MSSCKQSSSRTWNVYPSFAAIGIATASLLLSEYKLDAGTIRVPQVAKTIQDGIAAATGGDTVLVAAGTYNERVILKPGIIIKSDGTDAAGKIGLKRAAATIIDGRFKGASGPGVTMAENSTLDGFTVTGVGEYDEALWKKHHATQGEQQSYEHIGEPGVAGISVIGVATCTVTNNIVHHIGYTGIAIMGISGRRVAPHIVRNITYRNMGGGIGSMKQSSAIIEANICYENFYAGIGHDNASPLVIDNVCYANIRAGIGISEGSRPIVRANKCYKNRRAGIGVRTGKETSPLVENNECYENDMAGIGAREDATPIIRRNRCYKNAMAGIGCRTAARPLIEDNECFENKLAGIGCRSQAAPIIRNNRCWKNETSGIGAEKEARPVIVENECFSNKMAGIGTQLGAQAMIVGNVCKENGQAGIGVREQASAQIIDNKCIENKLVAIGVRGGSDVFIARNLLTRTGGMPPMIAIRENSSAMISGNTIRGGGVAGVMVQGVAIIHDNILLGNGPRRGPGPPNFAVWVQAGSTVDCSENQSEKWRHALFATGAKRVRAVDNTAREFLGTAIVVDKSEQPAHIFGNVAISDSEKDKAVQIGGPQGVVADNVRRAPLAETAADGEEPAGNEVSPAKPNR